LREERQGTVALTVTVTPDGRATDCVVTQSSGHPDLDHAACKELTEKARFDPAIDDRGEPVSAQFSTKITFRIK
jgi:protein TonB